MALAVFFVLFDSKLSVHEVVDCVVNVVEPENALLDDAQTVCTWNSYSVEEVSPLMASDELPDDVVVHVPEVVGLYCRL